MSKPQTASGYTREETEQAVSACLTVVASLGDLADAICVAGGIAPLLLIDLSSGIAEDEGHCGTNDLDVGLAIALLDESRYQEISERLRGIGFGPDRNDAGNPTPQRWSLGDLDVTVDFLIPDFEDGEGRIKHLEGDFAALRVRGLELAFSEREFVHLSGLNLKGQRLERDIPVCGPAAFIVLKAFAFARRTEPKDAYDLIYVLENWPGGIADIAARMRTHRDACPETVEAALNHLHTDFASVEHHGPLEAAGFADTDERELDDRAADAAGHVADLLDAMAETRDKDA